MKYVIKADKQPERVDKGSSHHSEGSFGLGWEFFQWAKQYPCHIKLEVFHSKMSFTPIEGGESIPSKAQNAFLFKHTNGSSNWICCALLKS